MSVEFVVLYVWSGATTAYYWHQFREVTVLVDELFTHTSTAAMRGDKAAPLVLLGAFALWPAMLPIGLFAEWWVARRPTQ